MYHGYQDVLISGARERLDLGATLELVDQAQRLGADYSKLKPLKTARQSLAAIESLHAATAEHLTAADDAMHAAGPQFLAGKVTARDLLERASRAAAITGDTGQEVRRLVTVTQRSASQAALADLRAVTEEQWIAPLRPLVRNLVDRINSEADKLGKVEPAATPANTRTSIHPWSPTSADLERTPVRHAWENMGELLTALDEVHAIATQLRRTGVIPVVEGREWCEDYRWLHLDELRGDPNQPREFWLSNRTKGEPGIYISTEMQVARGKAGPLIGQTAQPDWA